MKTLIYKGYIKEKEYIENCCALFIGNNEEPIAEILEGKIEEKNVSVRYWISDKEKTKKQLKESFLKNLFGIADIKYYSNYSEYTGYLWTDEELNIGGHDLLEELRSNIGKFIYLEIDVH